MADRIPAVVGKQILLRDISDVGGFSIFGVEVVERLVLRRAHLRRYSVPPFLGIGIFGVDIEDDATEGKKPVADDLTYLVFGVTLTHVHAMFG